VALNVSSEGTNSPVQLRRTKDDRGRRGGRGPAGRFFNDFARVSAVPPTPARGPEDWTYQPRVHGGSELSCPTGAAPVHAAPRGPEPSTSLRLAVSRRDVTRAPRTRPPFAPTHPPPAAPCTGSDSPGAPPPLDTLPPGSRSSARVAHLARLPVRNPPARPGERRQAGGVRA
jgi:hypothetical protein